MDLPLSRSLNMLGSSKLAIFDAKIENIYKENINKGTPSHSDDETEFRNRFIWREQEWMIHPQGKHACVRELENIPLGLNEKTMLEKKWQDEKDG